MRTLLKRGREKAEITRSVTRRAIKIGEQKNEAEMDFYWDSLEFIDLDDAFFDPCQGGCNATPSIGLWWENFCRVSRH